MTQSPVPNVVRVVMQYSHLQEICENVYHYSSGAAPTLTTMNSLIDALKEWETSAGVGIRSGSTTLLRIVATDLSAPNGLVVDRAIIPGITGTQTSTAACPGNVTVAVAFRTDQGGRSFRGRAFHIGMCEGFRSGNSLTGAVLDPFLTTYTQLLTMGVAPIFHLQVVSRFANKVQRVPDAIATAVTAVTLDPKLDSQRRRLTGK